MSIGIGLGAFMDGYQRSRDSRLDRERQKTLDARLAKSDERQDKMFDRQQTVWDRQDAEYEREESTRTAIADINTQAKSEFDAQVAAGTQKPDNFDTFWSGYALPKLKTTYLASGDLENADKAMKWGETADAKAGAKLSMNALLKAQTGDPDGALADVIQAGQLKGYIDHGYEVQGNDKIMSPDGQHVGYRIKLTTPDGETVEQDITVADLPKMIATFVNPEAAWQSQLAAEAKTAQEAKDLETYREKKKIDQEYGTGGKDDRSKAIDALRKRLDGDIDTSTGETRPAFDKLPREEQEKLISDEIALRDGQPGLAGGSASGAPAGASSSAPSGRKVVVDTATGKPVARGGQAPAPRRDAVAAEEAGPSAIAQAEAALAEGISPIRIAEQLSAQGVPEDQWPPELTKAVSRARQNSIGLGR
tara:strand:+ start:12734 stop:13993 length:1260 start_codon:yes stop_codon:yes gene_type:complete